jgi:hypothetical protein
MLGTVETSYSFHQPATIVFGFFAVMTIVQGHAQIRGQFNFGDGNAVAAPIAATSRSAARSKMSPGTSSRRSPAVGLNRASDLAPGRNPLVPLVDAPEPILKLAVRARGKNVTIS